jgi:hypothetical protein
LQYDQDERDNDQGMNPIAGAREPWAHVSAEKTKQPQDNQNYNDGPQHEISPSMDQMIASWLFDRAAVDVAAHVDKDPN